MPILIDYSGVAISAIMAVAGEFKNANETEVEDICRHVILNSLRSYNAKFKKEYGEMIICLDVGSSWRKKVFPYYKVRRAASKDDDSFLDWKLIMKIVNSVKDDLKQYFPMRVVGEEGAEGDDIIAVIATYLRDNDHVEYLLDSDAQRVLIISKDKDMPQLTKMPHVKVFNPYTMKMFSHKNIDHYIIEHIVKGDDGDDVPNMFSQDNCFAEGIRQKPVMQVRLTEFFEKGRDACRNDDERRGYDRNKMLVHFDGIPQLLRDQVIATYKSTVPGGSLNSAYQYLISKRCSQLLQNVEDFK